MKLNRFLSLPLIFGLMLSAQPCHAWLPIPSSRDFKVALVTALGCGALFVRYAWNLRDNIRRNEINGLRAEMHEGAQQIAGALQTGADQVGQAIADEGATTRRAVERVGDGVGALQNVAQNQLALAAWGAQALLEVGRAQGLRLPPPPAMLALQGGPSVPQLGQAGPSTPQPTLRRVSSVPSNMCFHSPQIQTDQGTIVGWKSSK